MMMRSLLLRPTDMIDDEQPKRYADLRRRETDPGAAYMVSIMSSIRRWSGSSKAVTSAPAGEAAARRI